MVTASEAAAILQEPKVIAANTGWRAQGGTFRFEATVLATQSNELLSLRGYIGARNRSYALLYRNSPIRRYTVHARHRNPDSGELIAGPHKHIWDDLWQDQLAYIPDDIQPGDPNAELMQFLTECNIQLRGAYRSQSFFLGPPGGAP